MLIHSTNDCRFHMQVIAQLFDTGWRNVNSRLELRENVIYVDRFTSTYPNHPPIAQPTPLAIHRYRISWLKRLCRLNPKPAGDLLWIKGITMEPKIYPYGGKSPGHSV